MKRPLTLFFVLLLVAFRAGAAPVAEAREPGNWSSLGLEVGVDILAVTAVVALILYLRTLLQRRTVELRASEEQFRDLFENAVEGIYKNPPEGGFQLANPAMARILGYRSAEELLALPPGKVAACYASPTRREEFFQLLDSGMDRITDFESEVVRPDGSRIWISENGVRSGSTTAAGPIGDEFAPSGGLCSDSRTTSRGTSHTVAHGHCLVAAFIANQSSTHKRARPRRPRRSPLNFVG